MASPKDENPMPARPMRRRNSRFDICRAVYALAESMMNVRLSCSFKLMALGWVGQGIIRQSFARMQSAPGFTCEGIVRVAGIDQPGITTRCQQLLHLLDHLADHAPRLAGLKVMLDLDQGSVSGVEAPCKDCCHVEGDRRIPGA